MFPLKKSICKNLEISNNFPPWKKKSKSRIEYPIIMAYLSISNRSAWIPSVRARSLTLLL